MRELYGLSFEEACPSGCRRSTACCRRRRPERGACRPRPPSIDGRRLRSERTRQLIIEAYLALLRDSPQVPTSAQIAERAGYSGALGVRALPRPDVAAHRRHRPCLCRRATASAQLRDLDGDRRTRIRSQVATRGPHLRDVAAAVARAQRQPGRFGRAQSRVRLARELILRRFELMYQPELSTLAEPMRQLHPDRPRDADRF